MKKEVIFKIERERDGFYWIIPTEELETVVFGFGKTPALAKKEFYAVLADIRQDITPNYFEEVDFKFIYDYKTCLKYFKTLKSKKHLFSKKAKCTIELRKTDKHK